MHVLIEAVDEVDTSIDWPPVNVDSIIESFEGDSAPVNSV